MFYVALAVVCALSALCLSAVKEIPVCLSSMCAQDQSAQNMRGCFYQI